VDTGGTSRRVARAHEALGTHNRKPHEGMVSAEETFRSSDSACAAGSEV